MQALGSPITGVGTNMQRADAVNAYGEFQTVPPELSSNASRVVATAVGDRHSCGVTEAGELHCFGQNGSGQLSVPTEAGPFVDVSAGAYHTCAPRRRAQAAAPLSMHAPPARAAAWQRSRLHNHPAHTPRGRPSSQLRADRSQRGSLLGGKRRRPNDSPRECWQHGHCRVSRALALVSA